MKKYQDYKNIDDGKDLSQNELNSIDWTKFKIIVPTEDYKQELMEAFEHIHNSNVDFEYVTINQLIHEYVHGNNIIVNETLYNLL